jgi:hypothetical protein
MAANNFNTDIPDAVIAQVLSSLAAADAALAPYKVALTEAQKKHLPTIGDGTIPFAEKTDAFMDSAPKYNPPYVDVTETHKDFKNFQKIHPVIQKLDSIRKDANDISIAAGSDAYVQYLAYYSSVGKAAEQGVPGAKTIYDELGARFPSRTKPTPPPAAAPPTK